jgi:hypothetical protein
MLYSFSLAKEPELRDDSAGKIHLSGKEVDGTWMAGLCATRPPVTSSGS